MAYTAERLEGAKKLFLKPRLSRGPPKTSDSPRYSLREQSRFSTQTITSTWIDDDNDENYDPKAGYVRKRKRSSRPDDAVQIHQSNRIILSPLPYSSNPIREEHFSLYFLRITMITKEQLCLRYH